MTEEQAATSILRLSLQRSGRWAALVAAVGGAVSDILNPLAPFAAYLFFAAALAAVALAIALATRLLMPVKAVPALVFALATTVVSGGISYLQQQDQNQDGVLAGLVPAVAEMQKRLGLVAQDMAEVKAGVGRVETGVAEVKQEAGRIARGVEDLAAALQTLTRAGGVVADPKTAADFYHNARQFEARGDGVAARRALLAVAGFDLDAIDPWQRLAVLARVQDGRAGARELFATFEGKARSAAYRLVAASLHEDGERQKRIEALLAEAPQDGPTAYFAAQEVSEARLGTRTLTERRAERDYLGRFLAAEARGELTRRFLDGAVLGEWLEQARRRLSVAETGLASTASEPSVQYMKSGQGWMGRVQLPETATAMTWRLGEAGAPTRAGVLGFVDPQTGKPMVDPNVPIPAGKEPDAIIVSYQDLRGRELGPFRLPFDARLALQGQIRQMGEASRANWLHFEPRNGWLYYTAVVTLACGIREARIGIGVAKPNQPLTIPPCDPKAPFSLPPGMLPYFKTDASVTSASVEIIWADGTSSGIETFSR
ncbi:MAG: hypothetical protein JNM13_07155 [Hyphomicrobiaceae bacterium]|nr:hypothetical protein [Hyphomicrobiaceae bacterium]